MTKLDSILKGRDTPLPRKVHLIRAMVYPVVMYVCESWTIKKVEHRRIDAVELWYWRRLLTVPWTARISNQSILKEISPGCSLEGLMLKLKLQNFGHLMWRTDCLEKTLMLGKIEGRGGEGDDRGWDGWMASLTQWTWVWVNSGSCWWTGSLACCSPWGSKELDTTEQLNWTELAFRLSLGGRLYFSVILLLIFSYVSKTAFYSEIDTWLFLWCTKTQKCICVFFLSTSLCLSWSLNIQTFLLWPF